VVVASLTITAFVASAASPAAAAFDVAAAGVATSLTQSVPDTGAPLAVANGHEVTVSWPSITLAGGQPATGYVVRRYDDNGVPQTVLSACTLVTGTSCVEHAVPTGTWKYTAQPLVGNWAGPESVVSAAITVSAASFVLSSTTPINSLPATVTGTISGFVAGSTVTYRLDSTSGTVLTGIPTTVAAGGSMSVSVTLPAGTTDAPHSIVVMDSAGTVASAAVEIVMPPVMTSVSMRDIDTDGKVDRVDVAFNDTLAAYTAGTAPWTLSNIPSGGTLAGVTVTGNTATLSINEGAGAANTAVGSFTVALAAHPGGIRDLNGHQSSFNATAPADLAAPAVTSLALLDVNGNGKVDRVSAAFSETLATYTAGTAPWALVNVPSSGTLASVAVATNIATLTITEGGGAANTAVGGMTVALTASSTAIRDAAGNQSSFAARAPVDLAAPVPVTIADTNGTINGRIQAGDTISFTFSEALAPSSVPASTTVSITDPFGSGNDTLTVVGVSNGARTLGATGYVTTDNSTASFASSAVALLTSNTVIRVTVGSTCSGTGCAGIATQTTNGTYSYLAAPTITDLAGNAASTTVLTRSARYF
jgi:hypothetical protein